MKYQFTAAALLGAGTVMATMPGDGTTTNNINFKGLPGTYSYQIAGSINLSGGSVTCPLTTVQASGPLAPLTNEMHHILRGPMVVHQFAVYSQQSSSSKRDTIRESAMERRGRMNHLEQHKKRAAHNHAKRGYGDLVTATIDGKVVTFTDTWDQPADTPAAAAAAAAPVENNTPAPTDNSTPAKAVQKEAVQKDSSPSAAASPSPDSTPAASSSSGSWSRIAYYDMTSGTTDNIMFTANNKFAMGLGFVQGYVASNGMDQASGPQALSGTIPDNYEVIISSGQVCSSSDTSGGCAVVAPGANANHGFGGDRVVIMEYTMPPSMSSAANKYTGNSANTNLPAIWALGSEVVNIGQYGLGPNGECSGWTSGAGEFDINEVLSGGNPEIGYASFHMGDHYSGTAPSGIVRPSNPNQTQKLAYVLSGSYAGIQILGSDFNIGDELSSADVNAMMSGGSSSPDGAIANLAKAGSPAYKATESSTTFDVILSS